MTADEVETYIKEVEHALVDLSELADKLRTVEDEIESTIEAIKEVTL